MSFSSKSKLRQIADTLKAKLIYYKNIYNDPRTPLLPKILLGLALAYLIMPFDLIPDFIPFIGQLDDLVIVPWLISMSLKMIPQEVKDDNLTHL